MNPETKIEHEAVSEAYLRHGIRSVKFTTPGETGLNDRIFLLPGQPLFIEFKVPGAAPRPKQDWWHKQFEKLGYDTITCSSVEEALAAIRIRLAARGY